MYIIHTRFLKMDYTSERSVVFGEEGTGLRVCVENGNYFTLFIDSSLTSVNVSDLGLY